MNEQYCENSDLSFVRWTNPETEEVEQFRSEYTPISYAFEEIETLPEFEGGKCPNVQYRFYYQRAIISSGTFQGWREVESRGIPDSYIPPFSGLKFTVNGNPITRRDGENYLYDWGYRYAGFPPYNTSRSYRVTVNDQQQTDLFIYGGTESGIRIIGFKATNNQVNCPEDSNDPTIECQLNITDIRGQVFSKKFDETCPLVEVICEDNLCPNGTCSVNCGNHICCYDNRGIAVKTINK